MSFETHGWPNQPRSVLPAPAGVNNFAARSPDGDARWITTFCQPPGAGGRHPSRLAQPEKVRLESCCLHFLYSSRFRICGKSSRSSLWHGDPSASAIAELRRNLTFGASSILSVASPLSGRQSSCSDSVCDDCARDNAHDPLFWWAKWEHGAHSRQNPWGMRTFATLTSNLGNLSLRE